MKTTTRPGTMETTLRLRLSNLSQRFNSLPRKMQRAILLIVGMALSLAAVSMWMPDTTPSMPPVDNIRSIPVNPYPADSANRNLTTP